MLTDSSATVSRNMDRYFGLFCCVFALDTFTVIAAVLGLSHAAGFLSSSNIIATVLGLLHASGFLCSSDIITMVLRLSHASGFLCSSDIIATVLGLSITGCISSSSNIISMVLGLSNAAVFCPLELQPLRCWHCLMLLVFCPLELPSLSCYKCPSPIEFDTFSVTIQRKHKRFTLRLLPNCKAAPFGTA
jgi:hypothetical protein